MTLTFKEAEQRLQGITDTLAEGVRGLMHDALPPPEGVKLGSKWLWSGYHEGNGETVSPQPVTITSLTIPTADVQAVTLDGVYYGIPLSTLSPLPEMYVGKEWVLEQDGNPWDGRLVKCVREDVRFGKYEQIMHLLSDGYRVDKSHYPQGCTKEIYWSKPRFIINCIDPAFWTGEIEGEPVRVYEDDRGNTRLYFNNENGESDWLYVNEGKQIREDIIFAAIEKSGIPIMPQSQSKGKYDAPKEAVK